ncbi:MAG TPA: ABC transporter ATP-binding protein [Bacteroidia bacterium]|nr:ABC transporter ATP-binding protein [Bacteroidia bacterium]HNU33385.1 ABC transporter ATP-binding protein [Bacteroidia bacterium]
MAQLLSVRNLSVNFHLHELVIAAIKNISFDIDYGQTLAIVGESGSGKSVTALSLMQLVQKPGLVRADEISFNSRKLNKIINISAASDKEMDGIRGNEIAMIFQEPMSSLNPVISCGKQVAEALILHNRITAKEAKVQTIALFEKVKLQQADKIYDCYPHQLSGGQKQRVMIAMAISCNPSLLIADEPTTALDVTTQKSILQLLKDVQKESGMGMIFISHDLGVVSHIADKIAVMRNGEIVETNTKENIFKSPQHYYTKGLLACKPPLNVKLKRLPVVDDFLSSTGFDIAGNFTEENSANNFLNENTFLQTENLSVEFKREKGIFRRSAGKFKAVDNVSLQIKKGEVLGIAGESGSGKTTLGRAILKLTPLTGGKIIFNGNDITSLEESSFRLLRKKMQIIFQDPYSSLNPKMTVGNAIEEVVSFHKIVSGKAETRNETIRLLKQVGLDENYCNRYPHELSGGQRQRICIARALAVKPEFLVCDECVSALDVSVQATILNVLKELKEEFNLTMLFISHDLSVLSFMCDRIAVMKDGKIEEENTTEELFNNPQSSYTKQLLEAVLAVNV